MRLPRFRYTLRTLFIVMTILAIPLGYVGWQANIVRERRTILARFDYKLHGTQDLSWLRRWLGDVSVYRIVLPRDTDPKEMHRVGELFPEGVPFIDGR